MRTVERASPRMCFVCGKPMKQLPSVTTLWCPACDVSEAGTVNGRWHLERPGFIEVGEDVIWFVDHGAALRFPTPDSEGYPR